MYYKLLTRMIQQWRDDWQENTLPFLLVQLPMHRYQQDPDFKDWPIIREAQMKTYQTIKNTGIAVILDCGVFNDIHPKDKLPVGERLALQALYQVYERVEAKEAFGPIYRNHIVRDGKAIVYFEYAADGFLSCDSVQGFELAGEDKKYVSATAVIEGDHIILEADEVKKPAYIRYCWTNYCDVTVYGKNGIPLAPFRTNVNDEL